MRNWKPSEADKNWLKVLVERLNVGGLWIAPMGFVFKKTADNKLVLESISCTTTQVGIIMETLERTKAIGELIGIEVQIENAAQFVLVVDPNLMGGN